MSHEDEVRAGAQRNMERLGIPKGMDEPTRRSLQEMGLIPERYAVIAGKRYEVPPGYELVRHDELDRGRAALRLLSDLDRCQHGRHSRDGCYGCMNDYAGISNVGNVHLGPGVRVGSDISGRPIVVPAWEQITNPAAWRAPAVSPEEPKP